MNSFNKNWLPWAIFILVAAVYLYFPTKSYYWDGISFAQVIENANSFDSSLIHPNHLIYNVVGYLFYKCALVINPAIRAVTVLQILNAILSAFGAVVLFQILKKSLNSVYLAGALTVLFAFSATWWKFSTDANAYIPGVLFLLISFYLVLPEHKSKPFTVAIVHAVSMFFHQLGIFFFPVIALGIFLQEPALPTRKRLQRVAEYAITAFLVTIGTYFLCFYLQRDSLNVSDFAHWLTSYSPENGFVFNFRKSLAYTFQGNVRLFFGGRFNFLSEIISPFTIFLTGLLILACVALVVQLVRKSKRTGERNVDRPGQTKSLIVLCLVWIAIYSAFLFFWIPQNTFYRVFYFPAFIILGGIFLKRYENLNGRKWRAASFVAIMALANFLFLIYPYAQVRKNTPLFLALEMNKIWSEKTIVYFNEKNSDNELIRYFNPATTWKKLEPSSMENLENEFENELERIHLEGGTTWLEMTAFNRLVRTEGRQQWLSAHSKEQSKYRLTDPAYDVWLVQIFPRSAMGNDDLPQ